MGISVHPYLLLRLQDHSDLLLGLCPRVAEPDGEGPPIDYHHGAGRVDGAVPENSEGRIAGLDAVGRPEALHQVHCVQTQSHGKAERHTNRRKCGN